jgi:hypothetical protein
MYERWSADCRQLRGGSPVHVLATGCLCADGWDCLTDLLYILTCTHIVSSVCAVLTFTQIPDDNPRRDRNMLDQSTDIVIQNIKIIRVHFVGLSVVCFYFKRLIKTWYSTVVYYYIQNKIFIMLPTCITYLTENTSSNHGNCAAHRTQQQWLPWQPTYQGRKDRRKQGRNEPRSFLYTYRCEWNVQGWDC